MRRALFGSAGRERSSLRRVTVGGAPAPWVIVRPSLPPVWSAIPTMGPMGPTS